MVTVVILYVVKLQRAEGSTLREGKRLKRVKGLIPVLLPSFET